MNVIGNPRNHLYRRAIQFHNVNSASGDIYDTITVFFVWIFRYSSHETLDGVNMNMLEYYTNSWTLVTGVRKNYEDPPY